MHFREIEYDLPDKYVQPSLGRACVKRNLNYMKPLTSLNILRGIGAIMIVVHHANSDVIPGIPEASGLTGFILWRIRNIGWSGIDLFLVLGGFFMGASFFSELRTQGHINLLRYWKKRAKRIIPSYYFLLFVLAVTGATGFIDFSSTFDTIRGILTHFLFLYNYLDQQPNGPLWYVATIVQFYFLAPLFLTVITSAGKRWVTDSFFTITWIVVLTTVLLRVVRLVTGTHQANDFMLTHFRTDAIFIGMLCMYMFTNRHPLVERIAKHPWFSLTISLLLIAPCTFFPRKNPFMFSIGFTMLACGYGTIILLLAEGVLEGATKWFACFGILSGWSYNKYLWHYFLPRLLGKPYAHLQVMIDSHVSFVSLVILCQIAIFVLASILVGYCMTVLVERPAQQALTKRSN